LQVKENATPADIGWMRLDFENIGKAHVRIAKARYRIDRETFNLETNEPVNSGGMASGNTFDLFPDAWKTTPESPVFLMPGTYSVIDHPSFYSMALLGMPDKKGWRVKGVVHLLLKLADGTVLSTPEQGIEISFNWLYPNKEGFTAMQERLRYLLQNPENYVQHGYVVEALLKVPKVAQSLTVEELLYAIAMRQRPWNGRDALVKFVNQHFSNDPKVTDFYLAALKRGDWWAAGDLNKFATDVWDDRFIEPLVKMNEQAKSNPNQKNVLSVLSRHYSHWKNDPTVAPRLSAALIKCYSVLRAEVNDLDQQQLIYWETPVKLLGMTRDKSAVEMLRPFLGSKAIVRTFEHDALLPRLTVPIPARVCDITYNAIMTILDQENQKINLRPWLWGQKRYKNKNDVTKELAKRDKLIRKLAASLLLVESSQPGTWKRSHNENSVSAPQLVQRLSDQSITYRNTDKIILRGSEGGYGASLAVTITEEFLIQKIWDSIYQSRPYDVWAASGYRKLDFYKKGQKNGPVLTLMVNATDACHIEGTSERFRCPELSAILGKLLKSKYEKGHKVIKKQ